jgi:transketolase
VPEALQAANQLASEGIQCAVLNIHTIKPLDVEAICRQAQQTSRIMTVEDHGLAGGLGSAVCEVLAENYPAHVHRVALRTFGESGSTEDLFAKHHLDAKGIYLEAKQFLANIRP